MKCNFIKTFVVAFALLFTSNLKAQKVIGFLGDWHGDYVNYINNTLQYEYLTDVVVAFALPKADGSLGLGNNFYNHLNLLGTQLHNRGKKIHFSAGGWTASNFNGGGRRDPDPVQEMMKTQATRDIFVANVLKIVKDYNLDGFNFDWEYPEAADVYAMEDVLLSLRKGLNDLEDELNKELELSIAVSATQTFSVGYSPDATSLVDYVYVMAFDNSGPNHSPVSFAETGMDYWLNTKQIDPEQLILAIPFYSRDPYASYKWLSNSDPAGYYNDDDGIKGGYNYNSRPMLEEKIQELTSRGGSGVFVWEIYEDRTDEYSLLKVLYENIVSTDTIKTELQKVKVFPNPMTDVLNINLNSVVLQGKDITYSITDITGKEVMKGTLPDANNVISTSSITSKGLYFVTIKAGTNQTTLKLVKK